MDTEMPGAGCGLGSNEAPPSQNLEWASDGE